MTRQKSFKQLVRTRMEKTGESYTAARAVLLTGSEEPAATEPPVLATSDERIRRRTGRGWEEWFDLLDEWDAHALAHREIARRVAQELGIEPLVWEAQAVTVSYERARGLRAVGQRTDGFTITVTKTVAVPVARLYEAFVDASQRDRWLPDGPLHERTVTRPKVAHFDWAGGPSRVHVSFTDRDGGRSSATVEHARLADAAGAEQMKVLWRDRLAQLKAQLEAGETDA